MISKIYWINESAIGNKLLGTMPRPRGNDWLDDEIKWLKIKEVDCLVSLLEYAEISELELSEESALCQKWKIQFINFPIEDVNTPKNKDKFIQLVIELANKIKKSKKVVIHCRMGIGRASVLAAGIMIRLGFKAENIFEIISKYRELEVPDTEDQIKWILNLEEEITSK